jgi:hypothetical protein
LVLHQKTDRDERRLQDQPPDWAVARQRDRDAGAERFAPHHDSLGGVAVGAERIRRGGVQQKPRLTRRSGRAADAVVGYADHAEPVLHEPGDAKDGLTVDKVSIIGVGTGASAVAAMKSGQIDGMSNFDPAILILERDGASPRR